MAVVEVEVWTESKEDDYARLLTDINENAAIELYEHLYSVSQDWCDAHDVSPVVYQRPTGKPIQLADVLTWYEQQGLLQRTVDDGEIVFQPAPSVQEVLDKERRVNALIPLDE
ncbi:hypothetical protein [Halobacterium sp. CBA1126]|uniref:hypothetical protein n=1 Tax=Halobacterium sp. CBA1126 TaxID=2668074 RepID=UPI0012FC261A|nr:hypothetical protein [Halobacterium sp. CBA1126]MUV60607.1 hypothetical protein [Halobacterium sp. CBA1126]